MEFIKKTDMKTIEEHQAELIQDLRIGLEKSDKIIELLRERIENLTRNTVCVKKNVKS
jgi:hypothetical protein